MKKDLFKKLPSDIIINILSRLPVRAIASSKCVCKPWLDLLSTDDFAKFHLSKSVASLAFSIYGRAQCGYQVFEFEDEVDDVESHDFRYNQVTKFDLPESPIIVGAANGLLLLKKAGSRTDDDVLYICNPITREYVCLVGPKDEEVLFGKPPPLRTYKFGASRMSRQHKVVRINEKSECCVYTLETGSWRRVGVEAEAARASLLDYLDFFVSAFVDGHLYWRVHFSASPLIACFDLETECFSSFDAPAWHGELSVVRGCLCLCECEDEIVLWLLKEKSWRKEYVIKIPGNDYYFACPINVFKNGDMLMLCNDRQFILFYNSNKTKDIEEIGGILAPEESMYSMIIKKRLKEFGIFLPPRLEVLDMFHLLLYEEVLLSEVIIRRILLLMLTLPQPNQIVISR